MKMLVHPQTEKSVEFFLADPFHSVGLSGEFGAGKGFVAIHIASSLLGCRHDKLDLHPYVLSFDCTDSAIGIETIREIKGFLALSVPGTARIRRAVILENIDSLGREAQNSLLKTLEETPSETIIITTMTRHDKVLPTIHSRLQHIQVYPVDKKSADEFYNEGYDSKKINQAYLISGGSVGLLSAIIENQSHHSLVKAIQEAKDILSQTRYQRMIRVDRIIKDKEFELNLFLDGLYRLLHASYIQNLGNQKKSQELAKGVARLQLIINSIRDIESNVSQKLVLSKLLYSL